MNDENLRTLVILHRVYAGIMGLFSCCMGGYFLLFVGLSNSGEMTKGPNPPPPGFLAMFAGFWIVFLIGFLVMLGLNLLAANWLGARTNWTLIVVVSALNCLGGILGIGLAVFTLIVVNRPEVRSTFR